MPTTVERFHRAAPVDLPSTDRGEPARTHRSPGPQPASPVPAAALDRAQRLGRDYAQASAPRSPFAELTGNHLPERTRLMWLQNRNKCNQFVGDVLTQAGFRMPTYRMPDGSAHFVNAEALPKFTAYFERVTSLTGARPGDLLVLDYLDSVGENSAHVEIISAIDVARQVMRTVGAHRQGAYESDNSGLLSALSYQPHNRSFSLSSRNAAAFILRPKAAN